MSPSERRTAVPDDVATPIDPLVDGSGGEPEGPPRPKRRTRSTSNRTAAGANGSSTGSSSGAATEGATAKPTRRRARAAEAAPAATSSGVTAAVDHGTAHASTDTTAPARVDREEPHHDTAPVELPTIVPATVDLPVVPAVARAPIDDGAGHDPDEWIEMGEDQIVRVPAEARAVLRPQGRRPRVRKVTRVLRHVDPWSTFKVAVLFSIVLYGVVLTAGVLLWNVALTTGTVDNVERWFTQFGWETFELNGGEIYSNAWKAGIFGMVGLTGFAVLVATLFNLVSDIVGGVRMTVLEEEVVERTVTSTRRFVVHRTPTDPTWSPDAGTTPPP